MVIMITAFATVETARRAFKLGAEDLVIKDAGFDVEELKVSVGKVLEKKHLRQENVLLKRELRQRNSLDNIIGKSPQMQAVYQMIETVAATSSTILITGESGTGKELVARAIHNLSNRAAAPFVSINCGAFTETLLESELFGYMKGAFTGAVSNRKGLFEAAEGGTIFLDEIGETTAAMQVKLLRVLQERCIRRVGGVEEIPVDVRVVAATNRDLAQMVEDGTFRNDLFYRISVIPIELPPLRARRTDIRELVQHFLEKYSAQAGRPVLNISEDAMRYLEAYDWPGNVRELKNLCEAIFINLPTRKISFLDLPCLYQKRLKEVEALPQSERERLLSALFTTNWNVSKAAKKLNWSRITVYRKLEKYHIKKPLRDEAGKAQGPGQTVSQSAAAVTAK
jgi:DNA-binding NtrC family response regulator